MFLRYDRWDNTCSRFVNVCSFNVLDNFDALLRNNIDDFRKQVYDIENVLIKCTTNSINICNGPILSRWA